MMLGRIAIAVMLAGAVAGAQQRDAAPNPSGTSEIAGVVRGADAGPAPIRRAIVSISGGGLRDARSVLTDDNGRFTFPRLPAGAFTITARKPAFLISAAGATTPGGPGSPVAVAAGERAEVAIVMHKGAVLSGVITDGSGQPLTGVPVLAINPRESPGAGAPGAMSQFATDDRGAFRIFGLAPGPYFVVASLNTRESGLVSRSSSAMDALLADLAGRQTTTPSTSTSPPSGPLHGFAPIYYPGTARYDDAQLVHVRAGEERDGLNFALSPVPVVTIDGVISGVANAADVSMTLITAAPRGQNTPGLPGITSTKPDATGRFSYQNVPPGKYRIVAREGATATPSGGSQVVVMGGGGSVTSPRPAATTPVGERLWGSVDVDVRGQDVHSLSLAMHGGGELAGRLVFDGARTAVPANLSDIRVSVGQIGGTYMSNVGGTVTGNALLSVPPVNVNADGTFRVTALGPTDYTLYVLLPAALSKVWTLESAIVDGRDLLDHGIDGATLQADNVVLTLTDRPSTLTGRLLSASGAPASGYFVVVFSSDGAHWREGARRTQSVRPATDGQFAFTALPPGEYFVAALTELDTTWQTAESLRAIAASALRVTIARGETKTQDLRIR